MFNKSKLNYNDKPRWSFNLLACHQRCLTSSQFQHLHKDAGNRHQQDYTMDYYNVWVCARTQTQKRTVSSQQRLFHI